MRLLYKRIAFVGFFLLVLLALIEKGIFKSEEEVIWDAENELTWEQFKGFTRPFTRFDAGINSYFTYDVKSLGFDSIEVKSVMFPGVSWVKTQDDYLLRHEQYHFNLTEAIARKFRKDIMERICDSINDEYLSSSHRSFLQELYSYQDKYDFETNHSIIIEKQKDWEYIIDSMLNAYSYYVNPLIVKRKEEKPTLCYRKVFIDSFNQLKGKYPVEVSQGVIGPHYKFFYSENKPVRIEFWNRNQLSVDDFFNVSIIEINYDGNKEEWRFYNSDGKKINNAKGYHVHRILRLGNQMKKSFLDVNDNPCLDYDGVAASVSEIDEKGRRVNCRFTDFSGKNITSNDGFTIIKFEYDENDNIVEMANYDNQGQLSPFADSIAILRYQYDEMQNETEIHHLNCLGSFQNNGFGFAVVKYNYDLSGNIIRQSFYKADGSFWLDDLKVAIRYFTFDKNSNLIDSRCYGSNKNLIFTADGLGRIRHKYDEWGNLILTSNYDAYDALRNDLKGVCLVRYLYNEKNQVGSEDQFSVDTLGTLTHFKTIRYDYGANYVILTEFDKENLPKATNNEIWMEKRFSDDDGNLIRIENYNKDKSLQPDTNGVAVYSYKYNKGNKTEVAYFDQNNNLRAIDGVIARETYVYDEKNQLIEQRFYDENNLPAKGGDGVEVIRTEYDLRGNLIKESYYTAAGQLMADSFGVACLNQRFDEHNNIIEVSFLNQNKRLVGKENFGIAIQRKAYSDNNQPISYSFYDCYGNLLNLNEGYARIDFNYDNRGNIISQTFYSAKEEPVEIKTGFSTILYEYDNNNNQILESYRDINGNFVENEEGYALLNWIHNRNGDVININTYNAKEAPTANIDYGPFIETSGGISYHIKNFFSSSLDGRPNEKRIISYYKNGNKESEVLYIDGKPEGKYLTWYESGELESETDYKNGLMHGKRIEYYKDGRIKQVVEYKNNVISSATYYESE